MDSNVTFRATNFNGGANAFRSFSERLDRKERYKQQDEARERAEAENMRRYQIAQGRLNASEGRAIGADNRAIESHAINMDNAKMVQEQNRMKLDTAKDAKGIQDDFANTIMSTNTEQADKVNDLYIAAQNAKDPEAEIARLNKVVVNAVDDGKIDLNQVTDENQYAQRLRAKLIQQGAVPQQIESMVKAATAGFKETDGARTANLTAGNKMINESYKDQMKANEKLETPGQFDIEKILKTDAVKNIGNPLTDVFDGFKKDKEGNYKRDKNGHFQLINNDEEIGSKEIGKFLSDVKGMDFIVEKAKTEDGKKVDAKTTKLTESQVKEILAASYIDNGPIGGANHIDGKRWITLAQIIAERDKDIKTKRNASEIKDEATRGLNENAIKYAKKSGAQKVNDVLQI